LSRDQAARVWMLIGVQARGDPFTVGHACAALVANVGADGAGVTVMVSPTVRETIHATDPIAAELEEWQLSYGQGPCVDAFADGGPVLVGDLDQPAYAERWPVFTPAARSSGVRALFALPLQVGGIRLGVLDLYRATPGPLSPSDFADALAYADAVGTLLLDAGHGGSVDTPPDWRRDDPTGYQAEVHQATGMIVAQLGVRADEAFARLRGYAYAHDRRLGDVARDVLQRRLRFEPDPPGGSGGG
jgi:ANTAR domain/GAF domain